MSLDCDEANLAYQRALDMLRECLKCEEFVDSKLTLMEMIEGDL